MLKQRSMQHFVLTLALLLLNYCVVLCAKEAIFEQLKGKLDSQYDAKNIVLAE